MIDKIMKKIEKRIQERRIKMFEKIQEKLKTKEGIQSMTGVEIYYASKWLDLFEELSPELLVVFSEECVMNIF